MIVQPADEFKLEAACPSVAAVARWASEMRRLRLQSLLLSMQDILLAWTSQGREFWEI